MKRSSALALALAWGVIQLRAVPWERVGGWVFHASTGLDHFFGGPL
jgi:hypothetical protein